MQPNRTRCLAYSIAGFLAGVLAAGVLPQSPRLVLVDTRFVANSASIQLDDAMANPLADNIWCATRLSTHGAAGHGYLDNSHARIH